ncbi:MAG: response regulator transcription factor [Fretibacterium sp.]|nr:response regulator transcription factor [Fretibacterium sp.]
MATIILVDDHKLFREGLRKILEAEDGLRVLGEGGDGEEGLELVRRYHPDILLFDIRMPRMDGVQLAQKLRELGLKPAAVAVSAYDDGDTLAELSAEGVRGFVLKSSGRKELLDAIHAVLQGELYADPRVAGKLMAHLSNNRPPDNLIEALSPREKIILYWIAQGYSNQEVAKQTVLSEKTVKNHVSHMLRKLGLRDRTQAAAMAWRLGFAQTSLETLRAINGGRL